MLPHRLQPTRLPHPWDSPGKNTGVGCHFLLQCMKVKSESGRHSVLSDPQRPHGLQPTRLLRPWDFPGRSTGVGCHCLLSVLFLSWLWAKSSSGCSLYARLLAKILKYAAYAIDHCSWVQRFVIQTQSSTPSKCLLLLTCLGTLVW